MTQWNSPGQAERFVSTYADPILRLSLTYSLTREDAQDICQDIFLKLLEEGREFQDLEHEKAFVLRAAINRCKDLLKSARRRRNVPMEEVERLPAPPAEAGELLERIRALPEHYGAALYLFYYEGYQAEEIGRILGISRSAVHVRLNRGREKLKTYLEEDGYV